MIQIIDEINTLFSIPLNELDKNVSPITKANYDAAVKFALTISEDIRVPEISSTPDGDVTFTWYNKENVLFTSIDFTNIISYAAIINNKPTSGEIQFLDIFPLELLELLSFMEL